jgi:hypothetical protein
MTHVMGENMAMYCLTVFRSKDCICMSGDSGSGVVLAAAPATAAGFSSPPVLDVASPQVIQFITNFILFYPNHQWWASLRGPVTALQIASYFFELIR